MNVEFYSVAYLHQHLRDQLLHAFQEVFETNHFILGEHLSTFEKKYAEFSQVPHVLGVANGLEALIIALKTLGIGRDDEVIVPAHTFIATWLAVAEVGARIVPVDSRIDSYNLDVTAIEKAVTSKTKAIIPVHLYGQPCEMGAIMEISKRHSLAVIEDNAQAHGARYAGARTGSFGQINATSFYPTKNLGALGDAGALTITQQDLFDKARRIRNYGSIKKYHHEELGINSRLDDVQAAFLSVKLEILDQTNTERIEIANKYLALLQNVSIVTPQIAEHCFSVYHQFVIRTEHRDALQEHLKQRGINTMTHYPIPPHRQKAFEHLGFSQGDFPVAEEISRTCLSLPLYPGLTDSTIEYVAQAVNGF